MAASISVSEVRSALHSAAGSRQTGNGKPTTALLGTLFHQVAAALLDCNSPCSVETILRDQEPLLAEWKDVLKHNAYNQLLGPLLTQQKGVLQGQGEKVLDLWTAVQELTDWLSEVWWNISDQGKNQPSQQDWFQSEQSVVMELNRANWPEPVVLLGQVDAVLKVPETNCWCVLEWKTGRTSPEVDLLQGCLYHFMLHGDKPTHHSTALAMVTFGPKRIETVFNQLQLQSVQSRVIDVIESLITESKPISKVVPSPRTTARKPIIPAGRPGNEANRKSSEITGEWQDTTIKKILTVLAEFGGPSRVVREPDVGAAFVRFYVCPEKKITDKKVMSAGEQLHLRLALANPPAMHVVNGAIGIDIPRPHRQQIRFSDLQPHIDELDSLYGAAKLPVGQDLSGSWVWCDLANSESCHLLVVGTPGSGKSQWLRIAVATLMKTNTPETASLVLIDPKQNAFTFAAGSSLLKTPIVVPGKGRTVVDILSELVSEMETRNKLLATSNAKDLREHIRHSKIPAERVICICDEYADLLDGCDTSAEKKTLERLFKRLAQVGRAAGFHLILATQQPRASIITPAIRSLIPAKIALRVSESLESRIAIEQNGAERLLGDGDLLFKCIGTQRLQAAWLPTEEERLLTDNTAVVGR